MPNPQPYNETQNCRDGDRVTYVWDGAGFCWSNARIENVVFCWSDVSFVLGIGTDPIAAQKNYDALKERDKERFIELTCKVKGYPTTKTMKKKVKAELTVDDITMTVEEVLKSMNVQILKD